MLSSRSFSSCRCVSSMSANIPRFICFLRNDDFKYPQPRLHKFRIHIMALSALHFSHETAPTVEYCVQSEARVTRVTKDRNGRRTSNSLCSRLKRPTNAGGTLEGLGRPIYRPSHVSRTQFD